MNNGYIYVLGNPSFENDLFKIGVTQRSPDGRSVELSGATGVPTPFVLEYSEFVHECMLVEKSVHDLLSKYRVNDRREFFKCPIIEVIRAIRLIADTHRSVNIKPQSQSNTKLTVQESKFPILALQKDKSSDFGICNYQRCYNKAIGVAGAGIRYCSYHMDAWVNRKTNTSNKNL